MHLPSRPCRRRLCVLRANNGTILHNSNPDTDICLFRCPFRQRQQLAVQTLQMLKADIRSSLSLFLCFRTCCCSRLPSSDNFFSNKDTSDGNAKTELPPSNPFVVADDEAVISITLKFHLKFYEGSENLHGLSKGHIMLLRQQFFPR